MYTTIITPYRISFVDEDPLGWIIVDSLVDLVFFVDIIINFLSAYYNSEDNLIFDRKKIALNYLKGWFFIDLMAVLPISLIMKSSKDYTSLARLARMPRLYRLIRIAKYIKN